MAVCTPFHFCERIFTPASYCGWMSCSQTLRLYNPSNPDDPCAVTMTLKWTWIAQVSDCTADPVILFGWIAKDVTIGNCKRTFLLTATGGTATPPVCNCGCKFTLSVYQACDRKGYYGDPVYVALGVYDFTGDGIDFIADGVSIAGGDSCTCAGSGATRAEFTVAAAKPYGCTPPYPDGFNPDAIQTSWPCRPLSKSITVQGPEGVTFGMTWHNNIQADFPELVAAGGLDNCCGATGHDGGWVSGSVTLLNDAGDPCFPSKFVLRNCFGNDPCSNASFVMSWYRTIDGSAWGFVDSQPMTEGTLPGPGGVPPGDPVTRCDPLHMEVWLTNVDCVTSPHEDGVSLFKLDF